MVGSAGRKGVAVFVALLALASPALAGVVPLMAAPGYDELGFTVPVNGVLQSTFDKAGIGGHQISGLLTSRVLRNVDPGSPYYNNYLFYYTIDVYADSDPITIFQLTNFSPPMYTQGITDLGYNTDVTGTNASDPRVPTIGELYITPPRVKYTFGNGDGVPATQTTEVFYIAGASTEVHSGYATVVNNVSQTIEALVNVYAPPQEPIVPEPVTLLLLGGAIVGMGLIRRRR